MKYFLVKENSNYADEFDIKGFKIFKAESEEILREEIKNKVLDGDEFPLEKYFGTNEAIEINNEEELWQNISIEPISKDDYILLLMLFPSVDKYSFGLTAIL